MTSLLATRVRRSGLETGFVALGAGILALVAGAVVGRSTLLALGLVALGLLALFAAVAWSYPRAGFTLVIASLALIPIYLVPNIGALSPEPTAIAALAIVGVLGAHERIPLRLSAVDWCFAALCAGVVAAGLLGPAGLFGAIADLLFWAPAYLLGRAVVARHYGALGFGKALVLMGAIAVPFVALEFITESNPFLPLAHPSSAFTPVWAHADFRDNGALRTEGAFGHPLSLAVVLSGVAVFAFALALRERGGRRLLWSTISIALIVAQATTDERSGWVALATGLCLFAALSVSAESRVRRVVVIGILAIPIGLVGSAIATATGGSETVSHNAQRADSADYRLDLYEHAFDPGAFAVFGWPITKTHNVYANAVRPGFTSIDAAYLQVGNQYGVVALLPLLAIVVLTLRYLVALRGTWEVVIAAVAVANFVALTVVGFQTQMPMFVWMVVGALSGAVLRRRGAATPSPTAVRAELGTPTEKTRTVRASVASSATARD